MPSTDHIEPVVYACMVGWRLYSSFGDLAGCREEIQMDIVLSSGINHIGT